MDSSDLWDKVGETPAKTPVKVLNVETGAVYELTGLSFDEDRDNSENEIVWLKVKPAKKVD